MITANHFDSTHANNLVTTGKTLNSKPTKSSELDPNYVLDDSIARFTGLSFESDIGDSTKVNLTISNNDGPPNLGNLSMRALISTKEAGVIIGKGGNNVAEVREKTGVRAGVSNVVPGIHERVLHVSGPISSIATAFRMIAKHLLNNPNTTTPPSAVNHYPNTHPDLTTVRLLIAHQVMGSIIGKGGVKIRELQEECGAKVVVSKDMLPQSTERIVEIYGSLGSIEQTVLRICQCIIPFTEKLQGSIQYNPSVRLHHVPFPLQTQHVTPAAVVAETSIPGAFYYSSSGSPAHTPSTPTGRRFDHPMAISHYTTGSHFAEFSSPQQQPIVSANSLANPRRPSSSAQSPYSFYQSPVHRTQLSHSHHPFLPLSSQSRSFEASPAAAAEPVIPSETLGKTSAVPPTVDEFGNALLTQTLAIPAGLCGCIIGAGGATINQIRQESGSRISISKRLDSGQGKTGPADRVFTITGTEKSNEKALYMLYNQLEQEKTRRLRQSTRSDSKDKTSTLNNSTPTANN